MNDLCKIMTAALMIAACDDPDTGEALDLDTELTRSEWIRSLPADTEATTPDADEADAILAELLVGDQGKIRFIDERVSFADGGVGLLAQGASSLLLAAEAEQLSPLELFMAVAPGVEPPARLREQHGEVVEAQGRLSAAPRVMRVIGHDLVPSDQFAAPLPEPLRSQTTDTFACTTGAGTQEWQIQFLGWVWSWYGAFDPIEMDTDTVSGNADVYAEDTTERWLGACVKSNSNVSWVVQGLNAGVWSDVIGTSLSLAVDQDVRYYSTSGSLMDHRARITNASGDSVKVGRARRRNL